MDYGKLFAIIDNFLFDRQQRRVVLPEGHYT